MESTESGIFNSNENEKNFKAFDENRSDNLPTNIKIDLSKEKKIFYSNTVYLKHMINNRTNHNCFYHKNNKGNEYIYSVAGNDIFENHDTIEIYDIQKNIWKIEDIKIKNKKIIYDNPCCVKIKNKIYLFGVAKIKKKKKSDYRDNENFYYECGSKMDKNDKKINKLKEELVKINKKINDYENKDEKEMIKSEIEKSVNSEIHDNTFDDLLMNIALYSQKGGGVDDNKEELNKKEYKCNNCNKKFNNKEQFIEHKIKCDILETSSIIYDINNKKWSKNSSVWKRCRLNSKAVEMNGKIYLIGGEDYEDHIPTNYVDIYDIKKDEWSEGIPMIEPRIHFGVTVVKDSIYVIGGNNGMNDLYNIEIYDSKKNKWVYGPIMDDNISRLNCISIDDNIYICGGYSTTCYEKNIVENLQINDYENYYYYRNNNDVIYCEHLKDSYCYDKVERKNKKKEYLLKKLNLFTGEMISKFIKKYEISIGYSDNKEKIRKIIVDKIFNYQFNSSESRKINTNFKDIRVLNVSKLQWLPSIEMDKNCDGMGLVNIDKYLYIIGGYRNRKRSSEIKNIYWERLNKIESIIDREFKISDSFNKHKVFEKIYWQSETSDEIIKINNTHLENISSKNMNEINKQNDYFKKNSKDMKNLSIKKDLNKSVKEQKTTTKQLTIVPNINNIIGVINEEIKFVEGVIKQKEERNEYEMDPENRKIEGSLKNKLKQEYLLVMNPSKENWKKSSIITAIPISIAQGLIGGVLMGKDLYGLSTDTTPLEALSGTKYAMEMVSGIFLTMIASKGISAVLESLSDILGSEKNNEIEGITRKKEYKSKGENEQKKSRLYTYGTNFVKIAILIYISHEIHGLFSEDISDTDGDGVSDTNDDCFGDNSIMCPDDDGGDDDGGDDDEGDDDGGDHEPDQPGNQNCSAYQGHYHDKCNQIPKTDADNYIEYMTCCFNPCIKCSTHEDYPDCENINSLPPLTFDDLDNDCDGILNKVEGDKDTDGDGVADKDDAYSKDADCQKLGQLGCDDHDELKEPLCSGDDTECTIPNAGCPDDDPDCTPSVSINCDEDGCEGPANDPEHPTQDQFSCEAGDDNTEAECSISIDTATGTISCTTTGGDDTDACKVVDHVEDMDRDGIDDYKDMHVEERDDSFYSCPTNEYPDRYCYSSGIVAGLGVAGLGYGAYKLQPKVTNKLNQYKEKRRLKKEKKRIEKEKEKKKKNKSKVKSEKQKNKKIKSRKLSHKEKKDIFDLSKSIKKKKKEKKKKKRKNKGEKKKEEKEVIEEEFEHETFENHF